jgi:hypothetical protein
MESREGFFFGGFVLFLDKKVDLLQSRSVSWYNVLPYLL